MRCCVDEPSEETKKEILLKMNETKKTNLPINTAITIPVVFHVKVIRGQENLDLDKLYESDIDYFISSMNTCYKGIDSSFTKYKDRNIGKLNLQYKTLIFKRQITNITFTKKEVKWYEPLTIESNDISSISSLDLKIKKTNGVNDISDNNLYKTLNIWLIKMENGILGYAQFPWDLSKKPYTDGVVCDYRTIHPRFNYTPYNNNKTAVHEVGHWLGLFHTFQTGTQSINVATDNNNNGILEGGERSGDCIIDTPDQKRSTFSNPFVSNSYPTNNNKLVMFMNYMDYVDDDAMFMFSKEQCQRMYICISTFRNQLLSQSQNQTQNPKTQSQSQIPKNPQNPKIIRKINRNDLPF
jgi:hypothetical protein